MSLICALNISSVLEVLDGIGFGSWLRKQAGKCSTVSGQELVFPGPSRRKRGNKAERALFEELRGAGDLAEICFDLV